MVIFYKYIPFILLHTRIEKEKYIFFAFISKYYKVVPVLDAVKRTLRFGIGLFMISLSFPRKLMVINGKFFFPKIDDDLFDSCL